MVRFFHVIARCCPKNIIERTVVMCQQENVGDFLQASLFGTNGMDVLNYGEGFHIHFDLPLKDALESTAVPDGFPMSLTEHRPGIA